MKEEVKYPSKKLTVEIIVWRYAENALYIFDYMFFI